MIQNVTYEKTCGACPLQIEGKLPGGMHYYFRFRHEHWAFGIGPKFEDDNYDKKPSAVSIAMGRDEGFCREGNVDYLEDERALEIIDQAIEEYFEEKRQPLYPLTQLAKDAK